MGNQCFHERIETLYQYDDDKNPILFWACKKCQTRFVPKPAVRDEIMFMAVEMEKKLAEHPDRPGWQNEARGYLFNRLLAEVRELHEAVEFGSEMEIIKESADVANFAMMLADNAKREMVENENDEE